MSGRVELCMQTTVVLPEHDSAIMDAFNNNVLLRPCPDRK